MTRQAEPVAPSRSVVGAFRGDWPPVALGGGEDRSWRAGTVVLKPLDRSPEDLEWEADLLTRTRSRSFRLPCSVRAVDGSLTVDGWYAARFLPGRHEPRRWSEIIGTGKAFHAAVRAERRPAFLERRTDPWSIGDRVAWGELPLGEFGVAEGVALLSAACVPLAARAQLIHGDLTGNVLFADGLPPAILDLSPYWRPAPFAAAIVVADALVWEGAEASLVLELGHGDHVGQYLARALIYRMVTDLIIRGQTRVGSGQDDPYRPAVELALELCTRTTVQGVERKSDRTIGWESLRNARHLGGLPLLDGGVTQPGIVIRSDTPVRLTAAGLEQALRHPIHTVVDLREERLAEAQPNPFADAPDVTYHHLPLLPEDFPLPVIRGGYREALDAAQPQVAAVLRALLTGRAPALVHCHSGTGRTGLVAVVLLELTGVTTEAIVDDFRASLGPHHSEEWEVPEQLLDHLRGRHGGVRGYLVEAGLTSDELDALGRLLSSR